MFIPNDMADAGHSNFVVYHPFGQQQRLGHFHRQFQSVSKQLIVFSKKSLFQNLIKQNQYEIIKMTATSSANAIRSIPCCISSLNRSSYSKFHKSGPRTNLCRTLQNVSLDIRVFPDGLENSIFLLSRYEPKISKILYEPF